MIDEMLRTRWRRLTVECWMVASCVCRWRDMDDQRVLWEEREGVVVEVGDAEEEVDQGQCLEMVEMVEGGDLGLDLAAVVAVGRVVVIREVGLDRVVVVVAAGETDLSHVAEKTSLPVQNQNPSHQVANPDLNLTNQDPGQSHLFGNEFLTQDPEAQ